MVELVQSYRELCNSIDRVANKPFDPSIDVQSDDFPVGTFGGSSQHGRAVRKTVWRDVTDLMVLRASQPKITNRRHNALSHFNGLLRRPQPNRMGCSSLIG